MWILIMFDIPTETKTEKRKHKAFLKNLLADEFNELLPTVYIRHCASGKSAEAHWNHVKELLPNDKLQLRGVKIKCITVTDQQFAEIQTHQLYDFRGAGVCALGAF